MSGTAALVPARHERTFAEALVKILHDDGGLSVEPLDLSDTDLDVTQICVGWKPPVRPPKE
jgi:hypothetical protein